VFFRIVAIVMKVAPIGAFGAMAYTVGTFGVKSLLPLGRLMLDVYLTMALFIFVVLNLILRYFGSRCGSTSSSSAKRSCSYSARRRARRRCRACSEKLERYGCSRSVVGLVIPAGYSFNLDGTSIYLSMAVIFIAQAFKVDLSLGSSSACSAC
jgi:aerobic C4-dicarboxylate transport protein